MDAKLLGEEYNRTDPPKQVGERHAAVRMRMSPALCIQAQSR